MVFPVHLQRSAVVAIRDCHDRGQFIGSRSLKQVAPQWIWLFQEALIRSKDERQDMVEDIKVSMDQLRPEQIPNNGVAGLADILWSLSI